VRYLFHARAPMTGTLATRRRIQNNKGILLK
jgi:hypothetical protein